MPKRTKRGSATADTTTELALPFEGASDASPDEAEKDKLAPAQVPEKADQPGKAVRSVTPLRPSNLARRFGAV